MTTPPWRGADKMTAPYIEIYTIKTKLYGHCTDIKEKG